MGLGRGGQYSGRLGSFHIAQYLITLLYLLTQASTKLSHPSKEILPGDGGTPLSGFGKRLSGYTASVSYH